MLSPEELEAVKQLGAVVSSTGSVALEEYTRHYVYSSLIWMAGAVALGVAAWKVQFVDEDLDPFVKVIRCIAVLLAAVAFLGNAGDLVAPKAAAIHQIIKDVRGSN